MGQWPWVSHFPSLGSVPSSINGGGLIGCSHVRTPLGWLGGLGWNKVTLPSRSRGLSPNTWQSPSLALWVTSLRTPHCPSGPSKLSSRHHIPSAAPPTLATPLPSPPKSLLVWQRPSCLRLFLPPPNQPPTPSLSLYLVSFFFKAHFTTRYHQIYEFTRRLSPLLDGRNRVRPDCCNTR